jgi:hypothetical protein
MFALVNSNGELFLKSDEAIKATIENTGSHSHGQME